VNHALLDQPNSKAEDSRWRPHNPRDVVLFLDDDE